jgi:general stress protein 26
MSREGLRKELDYQEKKEEIIRFLESEDNAIMVLATSCDDRVLARSVLIASNGLDIYFFTWGHSRKCIQIQKNPRVALCKDNVQIEGVAEILGGLLDESNKGYTDIIRNKHPGAIESWKDQPGMVIARVRPTSIITGESIDGEPYVEFLDPENETAYAERWGLRAYY